jgi:peptide/nickel transport system substrate-binding protein
MRPPEPNPKRGGTLRGAWGITTSSYDIHQGGSSNVLCHLYNNLVVLNLGDGIKTIVPDLARKWTVSEDGKTYTFDLREGVKYHDGTPFSSADVLASFQRIISPPSGIVSVNKDLFSVVDKIDAPDAKTFRFILKEPRVYFLELLADPAHVIYSKKHLDANGGDLRKVITPGTGPFMFKDYKEAEKWTFVKNPSYWDPELPYLDSLVLVHAAAWTDRGTAILTDQADMTWNCSIETWQEGQKRSDTIATNRLYNYGGYAILINTKKKPFDDPRVRRAINLAVSRQDLIKAFQTQEWINTTRWVPHGDRYALSTEEILKLPGYRADKKDDIAAAKKLLADAGYPDGFKGVDFLCASVAAHAEIMAPAFQEQLKRTLGIETKIRVQERALLVQEQQKGNFDMVLDTPGHLLSDIAPLASVYFKTGGSRNYGQFSNAEFDKTLAAVDSETDPAKRAPMIRKLEDILDNEPPWYPVGYTFHLPMWRKTAKGMGLELRQRAQWGRLDTAWIDK